LIRAHARLLLFGLFGCGPGPSASPNPPQLWLALNGSELKVRLVPIEPNPF
jgi:hypothetical protein